MKRSRMPFGRVTVEASTWDGSGPPKIPRAWMMLQARGARLAIAALISSRIKTRLDFWWLWLCEYHWRASRSNR